MRSVRRQLLGGNLPTSLSIPLEISPYTNLSLSVQIIVDLANSTTDNNYWCTKHIDVQYHFIKEHTKLGNIIFQYTPTTKNTADILTKPLPRDTLWKFTYHLGLNTKLTNTLVQREYWSWTYASCWNELELPCTQNKELTSVTNFIWPYLHQFFDNSHSLNGYWKPLKRPFNQCQLHLEAINIGWDIRQINW